jgi:hypothetical protein
MKININININIIYKKMNLSATSEKKDLVNFIRSKGFEPLSQNSEEPDVNDLWDIIDENGWDGTTKRVSTGGTKISYFNARHMLHRINFPAIQINMNNKKRTFLYYVNGQKHNLYGPAVVEIHDRKLVTEEFWEYGKQVERDRTHSISFKYVEEFLSRSDEKENPFDEIPGYDEIDRNIVGALIPYNEKAITVDLMNFGLPFNTMEEAQKFIDKDSFVSEQIILHKPNLGDEYILECANKKEWGVTGELNLYNIPELEMLVDVDILLQNENNLGVIAMPYSFSMSAIVVKQGDQELIDSGEIPQLSRLVEKLTSDVPFDKIKEFFYSLLEGVLIVKVKDDEKEYSFKYEFEGMGEYVLQYSEHYDIILEKIGEMTSLENFEYYVEMMNNDNELTFLDDIVLHNLKNVSIKNAYGDSLTNFLEMNPSVDTFRTSYSDFIELYEGVSTLPETIFHIIFDDSYPMEEEPKIDYLDHFENFIGPERKSVTFETEQDIHPLYLQVVEKVTNGYQTYLKFKNISKKVMNVASLLPRTRKDPYLGSMQHEYHMGEMEKMYSAKQRYDSFGECLSSSYTDNDGNEIEHTKEQLYFFALGKGLQVNKDMSKEQLCQIITN